MRALPNLAALLLLGPGTAPAAENPPDAEYQEVMAKDGEALLERMRIAEELRLDPALFARHKALIDSLSLHVHRARPQVIDDFNDGSHRVEIPPAPHLDYTEAFSYSLWLHLDAPKMDRETKIVSHAGVRSGKVTLMGDGRRITLFLRFADGSSFHLRTLPEIEAGRWTHLGVTFDRHQGARLFLDGEPAAVRVLRGDTTGTGTPSLISVPDQEMYVGGFDRAFPGLIDDFRIYSQALEEDTIRRLAAGRDVPEDLIGHWPFDETTGRVARDASGRRRDGIIGAALTLPRPGRVGGSIGFARDPAEWTRVLEHLEGEVDHLERSKASHPQTQEPATVAGLLRVLAKADALLVHYAESPEGIAAWIIDPKASPSVRKRRLDLAPDWDRAREAMTAELHASLLENTDDARFRKAARAVAAGLWDPIEDAMDPGRDVWLRLSPRLRDVPFSCLVDRDGRYLVERHAFARCGPVGALEQRARSTEFSAPKERVVALVNPGLHSLNDGQDEGTPAGAIVKGVPRSGDDASCTITGAPLFGTRLEVEGILPLLRNAGCDSVDVFEWAQAQEESVDRILPGAGVVHVATHGYQIPPDCLPSRPQDPLYLSGVVLAGAMRLVPDRSRGSDEGLLSAAEVAGIDLSSARLVVWSGCATATGFPLSGESMCGLGAAGWLAGAGASLATLWPVSDEGMPAQIRAFYESWLAGASPARALQAAHRKTLGAKGSTHPALWAALVVEGL